MTRVGRNHVLFIVARIFGAGHRIDCRVVKIIHLLARFRLHEPVQRQKSRYGRLSHY